MHYGRKQTEYVSPASLFRNLLGPVLVFLHSPRKILQQYLCRHSPNSSSHCATKLQAATFYLLKSLFQLYCNVFDIVKFGTVFSNSMLSHDEG